MNRHSPARIERPFRAKTGWEQSQQVALLLDHFVAPRKIAASSALLMQDAPSIMLSLALDPGRSGFRPTVIRVRKTKSAIARNDQRDALFQRPHAAIVPDVVPDVFYRAPGTLVGSARADVEQNGRCDRHYDEYELHGSSPIGQRAVSLPDTSRASDKKDSTPQYVRRLLRCGISIRPMTAVGQKQTSRPAWTMSALPPKADKQQRSRD